MNPAAAGALTAVDCLLFAAWAAGIFYCAIRLNPDRESAILAQTGFSVFQIAGGFGCMVVFGSILGGTLLSYITGEAESLDLPVLLWSTLLTLLGMGVFWMALVRRVWCTDAALVQRTWRCQLLTVPWQELAGAEATVSYDDVILPWGEKKLALDSTMTGFSEVSACLERHGVDLSAIPPRRPFFWKKDKTKKPFSGRN